MVATPKRRMLRFMGGPLDGGEYPIPDGCPQDGWPRFVSFATPETMLIYVATERTGDAWRMYRESNLSEVETELERGESDVRRN